MGEKKEKHKLYLEKSTTGLRGEKGPRFREVECSRSNTKDGKWSGMALGEGAEDGFPVEEEEVERSLPDDGCSQSCGDDVLFCHKYTATDRERIR